MFYILEALAVRNVASDTVKAAYIIWPREGWAMGMGAALLWLIVSFFCCCALLSWPLLKARDVSKSGAARAGQWARALPCSGS